MKHVVSSLYAEYGRYIDTFRAIPKDIDCLKYVERRLLLSVHKVARHKFQKSAKVIGVCIGNYHPHSDSATYQSLINLVNRKLVLGQGNWGKISYPDNDKAAAYRYTECKANDKLHSIFEKYLNYVPWELLELEKEPLFIPFPVPIGLISAGITTGIGFHTTKIPRYDIKDLFKRILSDYKLEIKPFIQDCDVQSTDFNNILTNGSGKIKIIPNYKIDNDKIIIYGKNPINGYNNLYKFNQEYEANNGIPFFDAIDCGNYESKTMIELEIYPAKKNQFNQNFINKILELVSSEENIIVNVVDRDNKVYKTGIDNLLKLSLQQWKDTILKYLNDKLYKINVNIEELNMILYIRDIIKNHPSILENKNLEDIKKYNHSKYPNEQLLKICNKYSIKTLIESHIDINNLISEKNKVINDIKNIEENIINDIKKEFSL